MADGGMAIGKPISRIDGSKKVTGQALYAAEYDAPGLLHAAVVSSRIAKGKIIAIDAIEALALPGVIAVLTHENRPHVAAFRYAYKDTVGPPGGPFKPLHDGKIRFADQPVAVVIGENYEAARDGAALVRITYEEEAFETDLDVAKAEPFKPKLPRIGVKPAPKSRGDFDAAFAAAAIKISAAYETAAQHHNAMELFATTVVWEGEDKITVYDKTQGSQNVQLYLKQALGFKLKNVRVVNAFVGGAFGSGLRPAHSAFLATLAAKHLKRSVRLVLTRAQMFSITYRADTRQEIALACDADGRLLAVRHACVAATSKNEDQQETVVNWAGLAYACENVAFDYQLARVDTPTPGDMRAPGAAVGVHVLECAMDELAYAAGIDPLELRLRNWVEHDQNDNLPLTSKAQKACYAQAAQRFGWSERSFGPRTMRDGQDLIGWGMAGGVWDAFVAPVPTRARVTWRRDGRLEVAAAASDIGTGTYTILAQIAAEAFGVPVEQVEVWLGDSTLPFNPVEGGSWMAASTGAAVARACDKLKVALVKAARKQFKLRGRKGALSVSRDAVIGEALPSRAVSLNEIVTAAGQDITATGTTLPDLAGQRKHASYVHSAVFAEVRVDEDLGVIRVKRIVSAIAAGRILNPKTAGSQIIGGVVMGIGQALHEEAQTDHRFGKVMNHSFQDYHIPANADVGAIEVIFVQEHDPDVSPLGVKGVGEIGLVGVTAAIANAVFHATGKRIRSTPITIDKLISA
ncbi:xanthine dehydrogenase family protein molybdopterin-binding subunit [Caulobacter hibisci]|uniref:Xanthine dehydrogenase family protein molybdopterin-binding subunit n=1 Tax=Caulobacter hibisci TaxID=2035993 RepID=A0ABS0STI1_9CAUL|nr:xanthine dehydrogenase family protein molybdopterin-binding subunit [Caulobacter hibisci]MBI1682886.1 xanthine dehydrogenase family protein molybdopterin-binding subunit [Caulobacter hibisci]